MKTAIKIKYPKIISAMEQAEYGDLVLCDPAKTSEFEQECEDAGYDPAGINWVDYYLKSVDKDGCGVYTTRIGKMTHTIVVRPETKLKGYFNLVRNA